LDDEIVDKEKSAVSFSFRARLESKNAHS